MNINDTSVQFIWASEETGFRHLYLVTSSLIGAVQNSIDPRNIESYSNSYLTPRIVNKVSNNRERSPPDKHSRFNRLFYF